MSQSHLGLDGPFDAALAESFEGMAFADVQRSENGEFGWDSPKNLWAHIEVQSPEALDLALVLPREIALEIGAAVLGEYDGIEDAVLLEVLGELINTLAGIWLREVLATEHSPELGIPKTGLGEWGAGNDRYELAVYEIDEVCFGVALRRGQAS